MIDEHASMSVKNGAARRHATPIQGTSRGSTEGWLAVASVRADQPALRPACDRQRVDPATTGSNRERIKPRKAGLRRQRVDSATPHPRANPRFHTPRRACVISGAVCVGAALRPHTYSLLLGCELSETTIGIAARQSWGCSSLAGARGSMSGPS